MYCKYCGEKLEDNATFCTACGKETAEIGVAPKKEKIQITISPLSAVGLALSILSFLFGLVLISCALSNKFATTLADTVAVLPALAAFSIGVHELYAHKGEKQIRVASAISIALSLFVLMYAFIAYAAWICR